MADERARLISGCARAGGDAGPASWATRVKGQARLGWASWAGRGRLGCAAPSFPFSFISFASIQIQLEFKLELRVM